MNRPPLTHGSIVKGQRTPEGRRYQRLKAHLGLKYSTYKKAARKLNKKQLAKLLSKDDEMAQLHLANAAAAELMERGVTTDQVHIDAVINELTIAYANDEFVGTRAVPVIERDVASDTYFKFPKGQDTDVPDDTVDLDGEGEPNRLRRKMTTDNYVVENRSYKEYVNRTEIDNQDMPLDALFDAQDLVLRGLEYKREKRIADLLMLGANHTNKVTVAAADRWDTASGGAPLEVIDEIKRNLFKGPSEARLVCIATKKTHDVLRRHRDVVNTIAPGGNMNQPARVTQAVLRDVLEVDEYFVAAAREMNTATYAWGTSGLWLGYVANTPQRRTLSFAYTFQWGQLKRWLIWDEAAGTDGRYMARATRKDVPKIVATDAGGLIITPNS